MSSLKYIAGAVADVLIPRHCAVCGRELLVNERYLCIYCHDDMPLTYNWNLVCNPMADRFNEMIQRSLERYEPYSFAASLFFFRSDSGYRRICYSLKYHGDIRIGRHFGKMLGKRLGTAGHFRDIDAVVPVPLHWTRYWKRGYNQAEIIAKAVASEIGAPLYRDMLVRQRRTKTQTRLDIVNKSRNVSGAFSVSRKFCERHPELSVRHILIIDDVFTTGATVHACHKALRAVFPSDVRISVATLACV